MVCVTIAVPKYKAALRSAKRSSLNALFAALRLTRMSYMLLKSQKEKSNKLWWKSVQV